jgi:hypothetical protein
MLQELSNSPLRATVGGMDQEIFRSPLRTKVEKVEDWINFELAEVTASRAQRILRYFEGQ